MRLSGRGLVVALVPTGTIAGHELGYLLAGERTGFTGSHRHLGPATWLAAGLTTCVLAALAFADRHIPGRHFRTRWLIAPQIGLFGVLEVIEHLHAGHRGLAVAGEPSFRWGVAAQLLSASAVVAMARLVRATGELVRACLSGRPTIQRAPNRPRCHRGGRMVGRGRTAGSVSERGPPGLVAFAT